MLHPTQLIVTSRLDLAPLRVEDAAEMVGILAEPGLYGFVGGRPPTLAELTDRYRRQVGGRSGDGREQWHNWIVRERESGAATGFVQATLTGGPDPDGGTLRGAPEAEVAWLIGTPWQGRGYASEAARALVDWLIRSGVQEIVAHVHPDHYASAAVAERAGLRPTDTFVDGERAWRRTTITGDAGNGSVGEPSGVAR